MCKANRPSYAKVRFPTEDGIFERSIACSLPAPLYLNVEGCERKRRRRQLAEKKPSTLKYGVARGGEEQLTKSPKQYWQTNCPRDKDTSASWEYKFEPDSNSQSQPTPGKTRNANNVKDSLSAISKNWKTYQSAFEQKPQNKNLTKAAESQIIIFSQNAEIQTSTPNQKTKPQKSKKWKSYKAVLQ